MFQATQFRKLQAIVDTNRFMLLVIYGRGRHRTLAIHWRGRGYVAKAHYSKATADEAAEAVARQLTLDGELPIGMRGPS